MNKQIRSAVRKYFKYAKKSDFISAERFAKEKLGYAVVLFNTDLGNDILVRCNCVEFAKGHRAFTCCDTTNVVFIDNRLPTEDRLYLLLHEVGHLLLKHIGDGKGYTRNGIRIDVEADAFVNAVLEHKKINVLSVLSYICALIIGIAIGCFSCGYFKVTSPPVQNTSSVGMTETVYVTASGTKFHRADCMYTKDKTCIALDKTEAEKNYAPCNVCKP